MDLFCEEFFAEGTKEVRLHEYMEPDLTEKLALHPVELGVAQHREKLGKRAISDWLVLPHFVGKEQGSEEKRPPSAGMQRDVRALFEPAEVDDTDDKCGHAEDALMEDAQDERADVQSRTIMHALWKYPVEIWLVFVVLHLKK